MPSTESKTPWRMVIREEPFSEEEWIELLEMRRVLLFPHLSSFTLRTLVQAKIGCRDDSDRMLPLAASFRDSFLGEIEPLIIATPGYSLNTQGIFAEDLDAGYSCPLFAERVEGKEEERVSYSGYRRYSWGLARNGAWLLIEVQVKSLYRRPIPKIEYVKAVIITESDPRSIIAANAAHGGPIGMMNTLGAEVRRWYNHRTRLLEEATKLLMRVNEEEAALSQVPVAERWATYSVRRS